MDSETEDLFTSVFLSEIKAEHNSDSSDYEYEKKWNADPLIEEAIVEDDFSEIFMPDIKEEEEVKFEYSECTFVHMSTEPDEESLTGSNNEDVTRVSSDVSSDKNGGKLPQNPTQKNSRQVSCKKSRKLKVCHSEEPANEIIKPKRRKKLEHVCNICNKSFTRNGSLSVHLRTHTNERPYSCNICNKSFIRKSDLRTHQLTHTNERPYKCNICNKSFIQSGHLSVHRRTHTNERPYPCSLCKNSFSTRAHLSEHMRVHTNERPYTCNICHYSFTKRGNLSTHIMRTHTK